MNEFEALPVVKALDTIIEGCRGELNSPANFWELDRLDDLQLDLSTRIKHLDDLEDLGNSFPLSVDQRIRLSEYVEASKKIPGKYLKRIGEYRSAVSGYSNESVRRYEFPAYTPNLSEFKADLHLVLAATNDMAQGLRDDLMVRRGLKNHEQLKKEAEEQVRSWKYHLEHGIPIPDKDSQSISRGTWAVFEIASAMEDEIYDIWHKVCVGIPIGHPKTWQYAKTRKQITIEYLDFLASIPGLSLACYPEMCYRLLQNEVNATLAKRDFRNNLYA